MPHNPPSYNPSIQGLGLGTHLDFHLVTHWVIRMVTQRPMDLNSVTLMVIHWDSHLGSQRAIPKLKVKGLGFHSEIPRVIPKHLATVMVIHLDSRLDFPKDSRLVILILLQMVTHWVTLKDFQMVILKAIRKPMDLSWAIQTVILMGFHLDFLKHLGLVMDSLMVILKVTHWAILKAIRLDFLMVILMDFQMGSLRLKVTDLAIPMVTLTGFHLGSLMVIHWVTLKLMGIDLGFQMVTPMVTHLVTLKHLG